MSIFSKNTPVEVLAQLKAENETLTASNATLAAELAASQELVSASNAATETANAECARLTSALATATETVTAHVATIAAHEATISELNTNLANDEARISERAQALLAASGHAAPLNIGAEGLNSDGSPQKPENKLIGLDKVRAAFKSQFTK